MFEDKTYEKLLEDKLARVPADLDIREGSMIFNATAPNSAEMAQGYVALGAVYDSTYADTATGEWLERRTKERGITRKGATYAVVQGEFVPSTVNVVGQRFSCGLYNYLAISQTELQCETAGTETNGTTGKLIPIEYIEGLESAQITQVLKPAEDAESDEQLRERYFESLKANAFGGNVADYKQKANSIDGVGGTKVLRAWNGGGTVKLTIIASDFTAPTNYLISEVQTAIDPEQVVGLGGLGLAPVGHAVTVVGVVNEPINVTATIEYADGWTAETSRSYINEAIDDYLLEVAEGWKDNDLSIVRISHIETRLLALHCIVDIADTTINGAESNLQLGYDEIPVRGTFNGS